MSAASTPAQVLLVGDTSDRTNWGCRATSGALRALIEEKAVISGSLDMRKMFDPVPTANVFDPLQSGQGSSRSFIQRAAGRIRRTLSPGSDRRQWADVTPDTLRAFGDAVEKDPLFAHLRKAIEAADVVLVNGEGAILQNRAGGRRQLAIAQVARERFGKTTAVINHTADLRSGMGPMARAVYPHMDDIRVRELHSLREIAEVAGDAPYAFAADAAFSHGAPVVRPARPRPLIVLGGSAAYMTAGVADEALVETFTALARDLGRLGDVVVTAASVPDDAFLQPVAESLGLPYFGLTTGLDEAQSLLASADLYVGGRWHPAILATKGAVPIVVFESNSRNKISGLLELLGNDQGYIPATPLDTNALVALAERRLADPQTEHLAARAVELSASARENVAILD